MKIQQNHGFSDGSILFAACLGMMEQPFIEETSIARDFPSSPLKQGAKTKNATSSLVHPVHRK
jgi:hypothetical protein